MTMNAYRDEFDARVQQATAGMPPAERLRLLRQWLTDYEREGRVPLPDGGWVSGVTTAVRTPARGGRVQTTTTRRNPLQVVGIAVALLFICGPMVWFVGLRDGGSAAVADVPSVPVTAADGAFAPITLVLGDTTVPVRRFDPAKGWPNPAATADAALWGGTTINQVFGIDARTHQALLTDLQTGAVLTLRRADGSTTRYRVTAVTAIAPTEVEYAAQDRLGLTVIAFGRGTERLAVQAVPADLPVSETALHATRIMRGTPQWTMQDGQVAVTVAVVADGERTEPLTLLHDGSAIGTLPAASTPTTTTITLPLRETTIPPVLTIQAGDALATLDVPLPTAAAPTIRWNRVTRTATGDVVAEVVVTPDTPWLLTAADGTCEVGNQALPLTVDGMTLPQVVTRSSVLTVRCGAVPAGSTLTMTLDSSQVTVAVPARTPPTEEGGS